MNPTAYVLFFMEKGIPFLYLVSHRRSVACGKSEIFSVWFCLAEIKIVFVQAYE